MSGKTVAILGGGWGGLAVAHDLRGLLGEEHRILVVERSESFSLCTSHLWLMTGERPSPRAIRRPMARIARPGIQWVPAEVVRIDPDARAVETSSGTVEADYLVLALGAELAPNRVPGLTESGYNLYDMEAAAELSQVLAETREGHVVLLIAGIPFRCPAAYEAAFLMEWLFRKRGVRDRVQIAIYTPEKQPMPVAGPAVGEALRSMLAARSIDYHPQRTVARVDRTSHTVVVDGDEIAFDLLITVPPHRAPEAVVAAGLTDTTGYVPVHPQTLEILGRVDSLETRFPHIFAIGDLTAIRLMNGMLLPKAGVFAEAEAQVVAENIAAEIEGAKPKARFNGNGFCYIEVGDGMAAYGSGDFYAYPEPAITLQPPAPEYKQAKEQFERVLDMWFE